MTTPKKEEFPSNSKTVQRKKRVERAKQSVPVRSEEELLEEGIEMAERKLIKPVHKARVKKKNFFQKAGASLFGSSEGVGQYLIFDVLLPAAKSTIQDLVTNGIEMLLFGDVSHRGRGSYGGKPVVRYGSYFKGSRDSYGRNASARERREYTRVPSFHNRLDGISFETRGEAEEVLDHLVMLLDEYEEISIADFYDAAALSNLSQLSDNAWGWTTLNRARIMHTSAGFEIDFPRPIQLD